jgi:hypothetical protein
MAVRLSALRTGRTSPPKVYCAEHISEAALLLDSEVVRYIPITTNVPDFSAYDGNQPRFAVHGACNGACNGVKSRKSEPNVSQ